MLQILCHGFKELICTETQEENVFLNFSATKHSCYSFESLLSLQFLALRYYAWYILDGWYSVHNIKSGRDLDASATITMTEAFHSMKTAATS